MSKRESVSPDQQLKIQYNVRVTPKKAVSTALEIRGLYAEAQSIIGCNSVEEDATGLSLGSIETLAQEEELPSGDRLTFTAPPDADPVALRMVRAWYTKKKANG